MALISLDKVQVSFGGPLILDDVSLTVEPGEKTCLLGRNGVGKSTLLKVIAGEIIPEKGGRAQGRMTRISRLPQEVPPGIEGQVFDVVAAGLGPVGELVRKYHQLSSRIHLSSDENALKALADVQHELEVSNGWQTEQWVETVISRLNLPPDIEFKTLSGGLQRRVLLAQAVVTEPDLLLLDEPTNHLDIESIRWLEDFLLDYRGAVLFITHDRTFLQRLATRILELDRGRLTDWPGDYRAYLQRREELQQAETRESERLDRKLAQDETWLRKGIKARRTRNEGRVRALLALREKRRNRREEPGLAKLQLQTAAQSGKLIAQVEHISFDWDSQPIVQDFSTIILRGDRIGIIGPNGIGKTTLINLLLGQLKPSMGKVQLGTRLEVAYYDQMRAQLDEEKSVKDNVAHGRDRITFNGRTRHIYGYLEDFLFTPERAKMAVKALSGGERNRLLLARLFSKPANVLVMDEPTNDLDIETLELLEDLLLEYQGTLLLVSHDRTFLDNAVTSCLVMEGDGKIQEYIGGYDDWIRHKAALSDSASNPAESESKKQTQNKRPKTSKIGLSYKERKELEELPARIERLETEQRELHERLSASSLYQQQPEQVSEMNRRWEEIAAEIDEIYTRWEDLEARTLE
ncbi:MAG: ATP-binding cassette domain-containing protein [Acidobacteriota bacterium]|nr:MAG: ATP-binding cassette domain-containing protein [Acidobacteriota bacterium]